MIKRFNCGDIVVFDNGYDNGISLYKWCKVLDMIVRESDGSVSYDSYDIITGQGDKNTELLFKLKTIGDSRGSIWETDSIINPVNGDVFCTDKTHSVTLIETDYMEKLYRRTIENASDKINFIRLNKNRNEKLNDLLDES
ncbi:MAG TPA: hypothetical protein PKG93_04445 [Bacilli bacterium]|nr:hypothetical protein [Bacilli bacterium]HPZ23828.1 hypothetical protein [Bacilli bacterium]